MYELTTQDKKDILYHLEYRRDDCADRQAQTTEEGDDGMAAWWEEQVGKIDALMNKVKASMG